MRTGRLLGAGRTADVYELHDDEGESGTDGQGGTGESGADAVASGPDGRDEPDIRGVPDGADRCGGSGGAWVLRRYRDGWGDAAAEAEVMEYVRGHGYPVPRVRWASRTEMVLERLSGPTMVEAVAADLLDPTQAGALLARLLHDLHAIPPRGNASASPPRILHLDLHPENVILTPHGPQVIDWNNTEQGPPGLDWGVSALILAQVAADTADSRADMAHTVLASLLTHQPDGPSALTDEGLIAARERRAANPTMSTHELELLKDAEKLVRSLATPGST
ncbi:phosphotransferase [Streptomyces sp. NPDC002787]